MSKVIFEISEKIIDFLERNNAELPTDDSVFQSFTRQAVSYLANTTNLNTPQMRLDFLRSSLLPLEIAGKGSFKFVLDHGSNTLKTNSYYPTIQITSTSGDFHAIVIKLSPSPLKGCQSQTTIISDVGVLQIGHVTNRIVNDINLQDDYPELYEFKQACTAKGIPIVYILGAARQFPLLSPKHANAVKWQKDLLDVIFHLSEEQYGDEIVFGTGGWAGRIEGSMGVPRLGYLGAAERNKITLTTMPHCGTYDRHENSTLEVFCGQEWGDDSPILAKMCDGAFVFGSSGTWTQIEIENMLIQKKPLVVLDNPEDPILNTDETLRKIITAKGEYFIWKNIENAANFLFESMSSFSQSPRTSNTLHIESPNIK